MIDRAVLRVEDLTVSYATPEGRTIAADGVSFALAPGETFGLVGESGSGKTTTAMAILNMIKPPARVERGRVVLNGADFLTQRGEALRRLRWREIALIPQGAQNALNPVITIREQIEDALTGHDNHPSRARTRARIEELLGSVGLPARVMAMYPHELSGGMKQRVCIAMAIALDPTVIVADEPTSALDVIVQRQVMETLRAAQARLNLAVILIGHDMGLQAQMVHRLGVMYRGRLVEVGPVRDVFKNPLHPYTRLLIASIPSIKRADLGLSRDGYTGLVEAAARSEAHLSCPLREVYAGHFAVRS